MSSARRWVPIHIPRSFATSSGGSATSPRLAALAEAGRIEVAAATDREAIAAMKTTTRTEGILPALETAHAIAALPKILGGIDGLAGGFPAEVLVLLGFSGRCDKDMAAL